MKRVMSIISILTGTLLISALPVLAGEGMFTGKDAEGVTVNKDDCLLVSMNCRDQVDTIYQRINKIKAEIAKGTNVYTKDELRILNKRLDDANRTLAVLNTPG